MQDLYPFEVIVELRSLDEDLTFPVWAKFSTAPSEPCFGDTPIYRSTLYFDDILQHIIDLAHASLSPSAFSSFKSDILFMFPDED